MVNIERRLAYDVALELQGSISHIDWLLIKLVEVTVIYINPIDKVWQVQHLNLNNPYDT